ncbi:fucolectin-like [Clarias gariepinus]|uniref:fucolectin-like n=1 Tax=Clarias gariepinus TaxID=13013 RepID=UPI00234DDDB6|nr:fucolectin-like [Clarias gariepinus]
MTNSQNLVFLCLGLCIFSSQWILTHQQVNVALQGIAVQSSTYMNRYSANLAIDGSTVSNMGSGSCTHTNGDYGAWWRVDLLALFDISTVIITNRGDACAERINGAEIHIGTSLVNNGNNNPRCVVISSIPLGVSASYTCNMMGRYVNIIIPKIYQFLSLCEVQVFGVPVPIIKRVFLSFKIKSNEDVNNPTIRDKVLLKIQSLSLQQPVFQIHWTKKPELKTKT